MNVLMFAEELEKLAGPARIVLPMSAVRQAKRQRLLERRAKLLAEQRARQKVERGLAHRALVAPALAVERLLGR
jgi:hypothetical protein